MKTATVLALLLLLPGQLRNQLRDQKEPPKPVARDSISAARLLPHVQLLSSDDLEGRKSGSAGAETAAAYMAQQFETLKLEPEGTMGYRQAFRQGGRTLTNIVARLKGSDPRLRRQYVVVGAHFDHLGQRGDQIYKGADDNASGCAALIEIARALTEGQPPRRSVVLIGFDGEESGLLGSKEFVRHPTVPKKSIVAMINLDMVSRGKTGDVRVCGTAHSELLKELVEGSADPAGLVLHYDREREWRHQSDHGPFGDARIPFLYFGVLDHKDYHRPSDTVEKINVEKLERITRLAYLTVRAVADHDKPPKFSK